MDTSTILLYAVALAFGAIALRLLLPIIILVAIAIAGGLGISLVFLWAVTMDLWDMLVRKGRVLFTPAPGVKA